MRPDLLAFLPVALPLAGAALCLLAKALPDRAVRPVQHVTAFLALGLTLAALSLQLPPLIEGQAIGGTVGNWATEVGITWKLDGLSWAATALGLVLMTLAWLYSLGQGPENTTFSVVLLIQTSGIAAVLLTQDLFNFFVCLEILGLTSYIMIAMDKKDAAKLASLTYLLLSSTAMIFFLLGIYGLYRLTGSLAIPTIAQVLPRGPLPPTAAISLALIVASVALRAALLPLYGWLPEAHAQAPHAVSAILSGVLIKTPLFALTRLMTEIPPLSQVGWLLSWAGALAAVVGSAIALSQTHVKRLLAYSTIAQIGFVVSAWGNAVAVGPGHPAYPGLMAAALVYAALHALYKSQLFMGYGLVIDRLGSYDFDRLTNGLSAEARLRSVFVPLLLGLATLANLPGVGGHASKVLLGTVLHGDVKEALITAAGVFGTALALRLSQPFWPVPGDRPLTVGPPLGRWAALLALWAQGLGCVALGWAVPALLQEVSRLIGPGTVPLVEPTSPPELLKAGLSLLGGIGLFGLTRWRPVQAGLTLIRERPRGYQGLFAAFMVGSLVLALGLMLP